MVDGITLAGWVLLALGFAGLYGAVVNETWLSVIMRVVDPNSAKVKIRG